MSKFADDKRRFVASQRSSRRSLAEMKHPSEEVQLARIGRPFVGSPRNERKQDPFAKAELLIAGALRRNTKSLELLTPA